MSQETDWMRGQDEAPAPSANLRMDIAHPARMYDYYLSGKDNFPADRAAAEQVKRAVPYIDVIARQNRGFLARAVVDASISGINQFLDVGTGIPTAGNTHQIAQAVNPQARVAYVDNDPIVLAHARALMSGAGHGITRVIQADLREPDTILDDPAVRGLLSLSEPCTLVLAAILHFIPDSDHPHELVRRLLAPLAPGSRLILSHATAQTLDAADEEHSAKITDEVRSSYQKSTAQVHLRDRDEITAFFDGLDIIEPGLVSVASWHGKPTEEVRWASRGLLGAVGIKR
jgi:hypothetical protein